jgi:cysteine desulfurase/selenocysteine lyase
MSAIERTGYDVESIRRDFPLLSRSVHGKPLVYLDNAASAQKPRAVIDAERHLYETEYANIHRGVYWLSERCTARYDAARRTVSDFLNAPHSHEIIFTRNATEAVNLVAASWARTFLRDGDEVLVTELEHHANIVPWQLLRAEKGIVLRAAPIEDDGSVSLDRLAAMIGPRTRLVAVAHMSNVLGTVLPVREITALAHAAGAKVLVDGAQAVTHRRVDVQDIGCDFYVFSGHKLYGPTGIGVLWGREALLDAMPPYQGGGDMIEFVSLDCTTYAPLPAKFEAGTPAIAQAIGLAAAIDYLRALGLERIATHEESLLRHAEHRLGEIPGLRLIGTAAGKGAVLSFAMDSAHPHDIATVLDRHGIAIRAGHHCAQPLMTRLDVSATARASFGLYNTRAEVDALAAALHRVEEMFRR